jgi:hypothetical protein
MIICDTDEQLASVIDQLRAIYKYVTSEISIRLIPRNDIHVCKRRGDYYGYIKNLITDGNVKGTSSTPRGKIFSPIILPLSAEGLAHDRGEAFVLSNTCSPDVLLAVNYLTTRVNNLMNCHRCLKYLNKTRSHLGQGSLNVIER